MDLTAFAEEVGAIAPVTITGLGTRGGPVEGVRAVRPPSGIEWIQADEMTMRCGAGAPVAEVDAALAEVGQCVALPPAGTVGGALSVGHSGIRRLGYGPVRDVLLQACYISDGGEVVQAGGPTVKNVSGFDLCRLLVGARGTLGFLGDVILRTRPRPPHSQWFTIEAKDPFPTFARLYRPASVLWDGSRLWALLEGHPADVAAQAAECSLTACAGPPALPSGSRRVIPPAAVGSLTGDFVAEVGIGVVHHAEALPSADPHDPSVTKLARRIKAAFDPSGRLNPGVSVG
ncbi:MAG: FAD-binding protein [Actinomycetota bacterium]|nr:FAD-binding protein [Actinomycetota bacterium]